MQTFRSVKKLPLPIEIQKQLSKAINDGVYKPGDKLPSERELVDQFQVSRVTIREALTNLQNAGLLTIRRGMNAGTYEKGDGDGASDNTRHHLIETYRTYSSVITEVQDQSLEDRLSRVFQ